VRVVLEDGVHAFSVATVAARAGISHRTVYRHFASREELLEGLSEAIESSGPLAAVEAWHAKSHLDHAREGAGGLFGELERMRERVIAEFVIGIALRHNTRGKHKRWAQVQAEVRERFPALSADEQLAGAAVLRTLLSSNAWYHLCVQLGVPFGPATQGVSRALDLILDDLAQRNEQAQARAGGRSSEQRKRAKR
jgi:AcrR family transcriptional regulator